MHKLARVAVVALLGGGGVALAATAQATPSAPSVPSSVTDGHGTAQAQSATLAQLKKSLRPLQDSPAAAEAAGYVQGTSCVDSATGGMGFHYFNLELVAGPIDVMHPPVLVYVPGDDGRLTLGAAEWFQFDADQDLSTHEDRPSLFGRPFDGPMLGHEEGMPIHYDLHAWLFEPNPRGVFQPYNPRVSC
jgi:hypothetical protein